MCGYRVIWEISVPSTQLCCEPKTALRNKVYKLKKKKKRRRRLEMT